MKKPWYRHPVFWAVLYLLALSLLTAVESADPESSIQSFIDALWYSVVTISTVGYGDLYPVTPVGRLLGLVFVVLSVGLLAFLVNALMAVLTGRLLPGLQLRLLAKRPWFLFDADDACSRVLARDLYRLHPDGVFLFPRDSSPDLPDGASLLCYPDSMEAVARRKTGDCTLFYTGEGRLADALAACRLGHPVYCMTHRVPGALPRNLHPFDRWDCAARQYWNSTPLTDCQRQLVILGDGPAAKALVRRGLLSNVLAGAPVRWHLFGDWADFLACHRELGSTLDLEGQDPAMDSLTVHGDDWRQHADLLASAHRVLLCAESPDIGLAQLSDLRSWYPTGAQVHLIGDCPAPGEQIFGLPEQCFTAELVMGTRLTAAARAMHEIYRAGSGGAPAWEELTPFLQQSNIAAADHLPVKLRLLLGRQDLTAPTRADFAAGAAGFAALSHGEREACRALEHRRWMRFHGLYGWRYAENRDNAARLHPLMVPYEALSPEERIKDDYAWELLGQLANRDL